MKQQVIRELSITELLERLDEEKKQYLRLKMNHAVSPLENPMKIKDYKITVARILTELKYRKVYGEQSSVKQSAIINKKK